jgi:hypothetical protein
MTPPRLIEFACPSCKAIHWEIDSDYRGADLVGQKELSYPEREYSCPACKRKQAGWRMMRASPPEFFLQPHPMYPMSRRAFAYWAQILREEFPDHPLTAKLGTQFVPNHRVVRTRVGGLWRNRRYYLGRVRRRIRQILGTGS